MNGSFDKVLTIKELEEIIQVYGGLHDASIARIHKNQEEKSISISFDYLSKTIGYDETETDEVLTFCFFGVRQDSIQESGEVVHYSIMSVDLNSSHIFIQCDNGSIDFHFQSVVQKNSF
jgi:hypothetical protein